RAVISRPDERPSLWAAMSGLSPGTSGIASLFRHRAGCERTRFPLGPRPDDAKVVSWRSTCPAVGLEGITEQPLRPARSAEWAGVVALSPFAGRRGPRQPHRNADARDSLGERESAVTPGATYGRRTRPRGRAK